MGKKPKHLLWSITAEDYVEVLKRAKADGLKPGDSMEKYFMEYMNEKSIEPIGSTNKDLDRIAGDLRESGKKVLNLNELKRKKKER